MHLSSQHLDIAQSYLWFHIFCILMFRNGEPEVPFKTAESHLISSLLARLRRAAQPHDVDLVSLRRAAQPYDVDLVSLRRAAQPHDVDLVSLRRAAQPYDVDLVSLRRAAQPHDVDLVPLAAGRLLPDAGAGLDE